MSQTDVLNEIDHRCSIYNKAAKFTIKAIGAMGYLLALASLKFPLGIKLYLNVIPLIFGLFGIYKDRLKSLKLFWPLISILVINLVPLLVESNFKGIARLAQVFLMINFSVLVSSVWSLRETNKYATLTICLAVGFLIVEIAFFEHQGLKDFLGIKIPRYSGFLGESNYSAIIIAFTSMLLLIQRRYFYYLLSFVVMIFLASRTGLLTSLIFPALYFFVLKFKATEKYLIGLLGAMFLVPAFVFLIWKFSPVEFITWVEIVSNGRFFLWLPYIDMGMDNILGIGYFQGWTNYESYLAPYRDLVDSIRGHQLNEQHNIFIQVFSEFGPICYFLFCYQFLAIYKKITSLELRVLFLSLLFGYSFLNGLNDYILYLTIGMILLKDKEKLIESR